MVNHGSGARSTPGDILYYTVLYTVLDTELYAQATTEGEQKHKHAEQEREMLYSYDTIYHLIKMLSAFEERRKKRWTAPIISMR